MVFRSVIGTKLGPRLYSTPNVRLGLVMGMVAGAAGLDLLQCRYVVECSIRECVKRDVVCLPLEALLRVGKSIEAGAAGEVVSTISHE